jgi:3-phenylpropionate/cinnamic acid dioxygenase small subunit
MLDDCRGRIEDRVTYVTKVWAGTFQDYRMRHIMQRIQARHVAEDLVEMRTGFVVYCTPEESGITQILTAGEYEDVVRLDPAGPRFLSKKVILDTSVLPRYLVYPL